MPDSGSVRARVRTILLLVLAIGIVGTCLPTSGWAFQGDGAGAAAPAAPPAAEPAPASQSFLSWMVQASGIFGAVLLLLSFLMVAIIMMNILQVRRENLLPQSFVEAFEAKLQSKDYQGAYEMARGDDSFVARVLAAGLSKLNRGYNEAIEGMQEVAEEETMEMEHRLSYLALIASISPMIGLLGTVYGMIESFRVIANSPTQPKPSELAEGISTALFTTLEGLTVAIPAMIAYSILKNRMNRYVLEVGMVSEGLMSRFSSVGKAGKPPVPGT
ncbi:MAG: MotA/TolQ/ExbB proton channel family protein [Planctomycetaceae bacterium]|nr:MotA/TolQ/ExbB proton channel family protein [Planctomycetaceae bacterium]